MSSKALQYRNALYFWLGVAALFVLLIYIFKDALLPFVIGIAVAYLLNPAVNMIGRFGISRGPAALIILCTFLLVLGALIGSVSPIIYHEFLELYKDLPSYIEKFWALTAPVTKIIEEHLGAANSQNIQGLLKSNAGAAVTTARFILDKISSGGQAILDMIAIAVFMPVVAYFMMKEWPKITEWVCGLIPRHLEGTVQGLLVEIDQKIAGFVRGQITVAFFLGLGYAVALSLLGLKYGFMIGLGAGFLSIIPMVGSVVGFVVGLAVAWFQTGDIAFMIIIAGVFVLGQVIEGNYLTPKLVGESVGLHPLWIFFALLAGGSLLGILGMLLAVPMAAVIGVLSGFAITKYKASLFYNDGNAA